MNLLFRAKSPTNVWMSWISKISPIHQSVSLVEQYMVCHFEVQMCQQTKEQLYSILTHFFLVYCFWVTCKIVLSF